MISKQIIRQISKVPFLKSGIYFVTNQQQAQQPKRATPPQLIEVKVEYDGELYTYKFPRFSKLAPNLQKARVPLEFECGYACNCENPEHFKKLIQDQPVSESEAAVLNENSYDQEKTRLSCQLFVMDYFKDITFKIQ